MSSSLWCLLWVVLPTSVQAQRAAGVVVSSKASPVDPSSLQVAVREALSPKLVWVDPSAVRDKARATPAASARLMGVVLELMRGGWRAYLEARPSVAVTQLEDARRLILPWAFAPEALEILAQVSLRLGAAQLDSGRPAAARDDFRFAFRLAPHIAVTDSEFKPEVVTSFTQAQEERGTTISHRIVVSPKEAQVYVNGAARDRSAPLVLEEGLHLIAGHAPGFRAQARMISLVPGSDSETIFALEPDDINRAVLRKDLVRIADSPVAVAEVLAGLHRVGEIDQVYLVASTWQRDGLAVLAQRCNAATQRCTKIVEIGFPGLASLSAAVREVVRSLAGQAQVDRPRLAGDVRLLRLPPRPRSSVAASKPWWKSHWVWIGAGAVAGTTFAAAAFWGRDKQYRFGGATCDFAGC